MGPVSFPEVVSLFGDELHSSGSAVRRQPRHLGNSVEGEDQSTEKHRFPPIGYVTGPRYPKSVMFVIQSHCSGITNFGLPSKQSAQPNCSWL